MGEQTEQVPASVETRVAIRPGTGWCVSNYEWKEMMNDPHVVALIYTVDHGDSVSYENAGPLRFGGSPGFDLTVEDKIARFEFKKHYADKVEAREAIEPFIQHWEFEAALQGGPGSFRLRYKDAEIVDRKPLPPEPTSGPQEVRAEVDIEGHVSVSAPVIRGLPRYPTPPAGGSVDPNDPDVKSMYDRYVNYCSGGEFLPGMAYFCLTMLEYKCKGKKARDEAAAKYIIHEDVLNKIGHLSAMGGPIGRKGGTVALTEREKRWLRKSVKKIIYRAAQVAADDSQHLPQITMADLPSL